FQTPPEAWLTSSSGEASVDSAEIERMLEERRKAREAKDFETADRVRDQLEAEGVILEDGPDKTRWRLA
ncbi:MAG: CysS/YqeB C-terminal domain-containing protein, partial [Geminicoccaceae bacterium]